MTNQGRLECRHGEFIGDEKARPLCCANQMNCQKPKVWFSLHLRAVFNQELVH